MTDKKICKQKPIKVSLNNIILLRNKSTTIL